MNVPILESKINSVKDWSGGALDGCRNLDLKAPLGRSFVYFLV
jgi:hypothetical protein